MLHDQHFLESISNNMRNPGIIETGRSALPSSFHPRPKSHWPIRVSRRTLSYNSRGLLVESPASFDPGPVRGIFCSNGVFLVHDFYLIFLYLTFTPYLFQNAGMKRIANISVILLVSSTFLFSSRMVPVWFWAGVHGISYGSVFSACDGTIMELFVAVKTGYLIALRVTAEVRFRNSTDPA